MNTPGTAGGPGGSDRTLAIQSRKTAEKNTLFSLRNKIYPIFFFLHIFSSYAKILGETNFHTREFTRSGSKAKDGGEKKERLNNGNDNGQLRIVNATSCGARIAVWANLCRWIQNVDRMVKKMQSSF